jgi:uncharacterized protein with FMN-binding domain
MKQPPPRRPAAPSWAEPASQRSFWPGSRSSRVTAGLVGLSGAAILSVYAVGYMNTNAAADQLTASGPDGTLPGSGGAGSSSVAPSGNPRVQRNPSDSGGDDGGGNRAPQPSQNAPTATPTPSQPGSGQGARGSSGSAAPQQQAAGYRDGTYVGVGNSRHGGIQVSVVVKSGKVTSASVTGCGTRYPCSKVNPLVSEVVNRQGAPVDYVSGATDSSMAYIQAVRSALSQASSQAG